MQNCRYSFKIKLFLSFIFLLFLNNLNFAQTGILDSSFGAGGIVITGKTSEIPAGIAIQADGKILIGGHSTVGGNFFPSQVAISRFNPDGNIDTTFGYLGVVHTKFPNNSFRGCEIAIQTDGKIVIAGTNYSEFALARYGANGDLDSTFGDNGFVSVDISGSFDEAISMLIQPDGKILISGQSRINLMHDISIARFESDGSLDISFGNQGKVIVSVSPTGQEYGEAMVVQPDGKIVVAGSYFNGTDQDFVVIRYQINGSLDSTFGIGGIKTLHISDTADYCHAMLLQQDGKIVLGGQTVVGLDSTVITLARLLPDGSIDSLFGSSGISHPVNNVYSYVADLMIDPFDRFFIISNNIYRCLNDGSLDLSFGISGTVPITNDFFLLVEPLPDSSVIIAGYESNFGNYNILLSKYDIDGVIDSSFGSNGITLYDYGVPFDMYALDMRMQDDGKAVMLGNYDFPSTSPGVILTRYDTTGILDRSFGVEGVSSINTDAVMQRFAIQSEGKIIAAGLTAQHNFGLMRFESNGFLDSTFGVNGTIDSPTSIITYSGPGVTGIALQSDGKIVVTGYTPAGIATVRYLTDGTLDVTFSGDGIAVHNFNGTLNNVYDLNIQTDGRILVAGSFRDTNLVIKMGIMRYHINGAPDNSFGVNGRVEIYHPDGVVAYGIFVQSDNKILITGTTLANYSELVLVKLNQNGSPDTTFGSDGIVISNYSTSDDAGYRVLTQSDGKIVVGALSLFGLGLIRYNIDGTIDLGFGSSGLASTNVSGISCKSLALLPGGKIMVAGGLSFNDFFFILAKFDSSGCVAPLITASGPTSFCVGGSVVLTSGSNVGSTFQWNRNGVNIPGATNPSYTATASGRYTATTTDSICASTMTSNEIRVRIPCFPPMDPQEKIQLNDAGQSEVEMLVTYLSSNQSAELEATGLKGSIYTVLIIDSNGRVLLKENGQISNSELMKQFDCFSFSTGMYIIKLTTDKENLSRVFLKAE